MNIYKARDIYANNYIRIKEKKYAYPKFGIVSSLDRNLDYIYIPKYELISEGKVLQEDDINEFIFSNNTEDDELLKHTILYNKTSYSLIAHLYSRYSFVLKKEQVNENFYFINNIDRISKERIKNSNIIFLKDDGVFLLSNSPNELMKLIDELEDVCEKNYNSFLYTNDEYLQVKDELKGCKVTKKEHKEIMLEMLTHFSKICIDNGIKYSLSGGTLLGAIRNGGMIPWDDDVDIFMTRTEYNKLLKLYDNKHRFIIDSWDINKECKYFYPRLIDTKTVVVNAKNSFAANDNGVSIDIFPIDGTSKYSIKRFFDYYCIRFLWRIRRSYLEDRRNRLKKKNIFKYYIKLIVVKLSDFSFWNDMLNKKVREYSYDNSDIAGNLASNYKKKDLMNRKCFDDYETIEFEGNKYMICSEYETYLNNLYKSYYKIPKKRKGHHLNQIEWK